eukprot:gnl/TRDRNA2_/TRDRNA2_169698_c0_seq2.p1 gnl/TRDRNA2_/TRDRNA2_169698_c0~~gnl/TRDRNA2_/TRDRNA2_169698_c0_seq2.p1  ORF type:complete len:341 (+),score=71.88 gnl/TRDRNA2_/TRDRNA2_169698_c0_seq2:172-1194(+)
MEVSPQNIFERGFAVCLILIAMISFSTFVSSITASMTRLRSINQDMTTQHFHLRKFFKDHHISWDLSARITRHIDLTVDLHKHRMDRDKVELLKHLSGPLNMELQTEMTLPFLLVHPFFLEFQTWSSPATSELCFRAVFMNAMAKGDYLFDFSAEAHQMFIISRGILCYQRPSGLKVKGVKRSTHLAKDQWCCEPALWVPWVHRGTMFTMVASEIVEIDATKFMEVARAHKDVFNMTREYAKTFVTDLQHERDVVGFVFDVPPCFLFQKGVVGSNVGHFTSYHLEVASALEFEAAMGKTADESDEEEEDAEAEGLEEQLEELEDREEAEREANVQAQESK